MLLISKTVKIYKQKINKAPLNVDIYSPPVTFPP